jgi:hypothetical protein
MPALARSDSPAPGPRAPRLRAVDVPDAPARTGLSAWDVARFALGLTIGFLLAAVASAPGGDAVVAGQTLLACLAALTAALALLRHRAQSLGVRRQASRSA